MEGVQISRHFRKCCKKLLLNSEEIITPPSMEAVFRPGLSFIYIFAYSLTALTQTSHGRIFVKIAI